MEWKNKYNPFNSWKALTHSQHFEAILKGKPKPPIVVNFDLTNKCNYNCGFCMFANCKRADKTSSQFRNNESMPEGYSLLLPKLWKDWGVKAVCLAGGGEPTLHPQFHDIIDLLIVQGSIIYTNGFVEQTILRYFVRAELLVKRLALIRWMHHPTCP